MLLWTINKLLYHCIILYTGMHNTSYLFSQDYTPHSTGSLHNNILLKWGLRASSEQYLAWRCPWSCCWWRGRGAARTAGSRWRAPATAPPLTASPGTRRRRWAVYKVLCSAPLVPQPVVQSRRRPLLGPSPGWKRLLALSHLRHY